MYLGQYVVKNTKVWNTFLKKRKSCISQSVHLETIFVIELLVFVTTPFYVCY